MSCDLLCSVVMPPYLWHGMKNWKICGLCVCLFSRIHSCYATSIPTFKRSLSNHNTLFTFLFQLAGPEYFVLLFLIVNVVKVSVIFIFHISVTGTTHCQSFPFFFFADSMCWVLRNLRISRVNVICYAFAARLYGVNQIKNSLITHYLFNATWPSFLLAGHGSQC